MDSVRRASITLPSFLVVPSLSLFAQPCHHHFHSTFYPKPQLTFSLTSKTFDTTDLTSSSSTNGDKINDFKATIGSP